MLLNTMKLSPARNWMSSNVERCYEAGFIMNNLVNSGAWKSFAFILSFTLLMVIGISNCYPQTNDNEEVMSEEIKMTENEFHQKYAVGLNNLAWHLLGKEDRTEQDEEMLINAAHTSYYHWSRIGTAINLQRGHWLT